MEQPSCGCFAHVDMTQFEGSRCEHGENGDQTDQTKVIVALPAILMTASAEAE